MCEDEGALVMDGANIHAFEAEVNCSPILS